MTERFTLDDFRSQMAMIAKPGLMQKMMGMMPGMGQMREAMNEFDEGELKGLFGIIDAMTPQERCESRVIDRDRRRRIAAGAGCTPQQVLELVRQYESMAQVMTAIRGKEVRRRLDMDDGAQDDFPRSPRPPQPGDGDDLPPESPPPSLDA